VIVVIQQFLFIPFCFFVVTELVQNTDE